MAPSGEDKKQMVSSAGPTRQCRAVAAGRVVSEQGVRELRLEGGFDGVKALAAMGLSSEEAEVARFFVNLNHERNDWEQVSGGSTLIGANARGIARETANNGRAARPRRQPARLE